MASASDVPNLFDIVVNGQGYMLAEPEQVRALYGWTPTFVDRSNVGAQYGDEDQDFFFTVSQSDWSLGEEQRYFDLTDEDRRRRYWRGSNVDASTVPGQVSLRNTSPSLTFAQTTAACDVIPGQSMYVACTNNLYAVSPTGTLTDAGAHGLSGTLGPYGMATDMAAVYICSTTTGVRRLVPGGAFTTFSASAMSSLCVFGNTLYGYLTSNNAFYKFSTTGVTTLISYVSDVAGTSTSQLVNHVCQLRAAANSIYLLRSYGLRQPAELWQYDGTNVTRIASLPGDFVPYWMEESIGILFMSGLVYSGTQQLPAIYYYVRGTVGLLWISSTASAAAPGMIAWNRGLAFTDDATGALLLYDIASGGVHRIASIAVGTGTPQLTVKDGVIVQIRIGTTAGNYFPTGTAATSGFVISSLFNFGNTLTKQFRGITIDGIIPSGATFDIAYRTDDVDGSYTTLQTGAIPGTEYSLAGVSGRAISVKITLNKGSSTPGPMLTRVYVRAAPQLKRFRKLTCLLDCSGRDGRSNIKLRNGQPHPLDGMAMVVNLKTAIDSLSPIAITDRLGTFNALLAPDQCEIREIGSEEFVVKIVGREV